MLKIITAKSAAEFKAMRYEILEVRCLTMADALDLIRELKAKTPEKMFMIRR